MMTDWSFKAESTSEEEQQTAFGDHRIAMSAAIAAAGADSDVTILHAEAVNKSYPMFFEDYNQLGGRANVIPME